MKPLSKPLSKMACTIALALLAAPVLAQQFPNKQVRLMVPFPPGGPTDALARPLADGLTRAWGQPVIIENKPGANTIIGTDYVVKQPADGHNILLASDPSMSSIQYLYSKLPFDPVKDLLPVSGIATTTLIMLAPANSPANSLREWIALAKAQPGKLSYGSIGPGSVTHLEADAFARVAGVNLIHVPYKGTSEVVPAILNGQIDMALSAIGASMSLIKAGKMKAFALANTVRSPLVPDVPTFAEAGLPFEARSWFGLAVAAGTPRAIVERIASDSRKITESEEYRTKYIAGIGLDPFPLGPEGLAEFLVKDRARYAQRVKAANVRLD